MKRETKQERESEMKGTRKGREDSLRSRRRTFTQVHRYPCVFAPVPSRGTGDTKPITATPHRPLREAERGRTGTRGKQTAGNGEIDNGDDTRKGRETKRSEREMTERKGQEMKRQGRDAKEVGVGDRVNGSDRTRQRGGTSYGTSERSPESRA